MISLVKIGVIGALAEEIKLLLENLQNKEVDIALRHSFYKGVLAGHQVVLATSGIGKARAAARTQFLIDHFDIQKLIFVGVAGAINPELGLGDVVVSRCALQHDLDYGGPSDSKVRNYWYEADPLLIDLAMKAGERLELGGKLLLGSVLSGDQTITCTSRKQWLWQTCGGDCVEMEGAAVAMVCWMNEMPWVLIRTISDLADEQIYDHLQGCFHQAADCSARIALEMLTLLSPGL